ncbi:hypothetical protein [Verrucomicrobium sp. 3C]|uniref:hypothetical protein n=1 Tax=Verrucomicrobium sp. 3C TaxID=1134055 RepID=UPI00039A6A95|nr:hypothetical protein [Verrucomicrobium sp. 3C]
MRRLRRRFWRATGHAYELAAAFRVTRETIRRWRKGSVRFFVCGSIFRFVV